MAKKKRYRDGRKFCSVELFDASVERVAAPQQTGRTWRGKCLSIIVSCRRHAPPAASKASRFRVTPGPRSRFVLDGDANVAGASLGSGLTELEDLDPKSGDY